MLGWLRLGTIERKLFATTLLFALLVIGFAWLLLSALTGYEHRQIREADTLELIGKMEPNIARAAWRLNDDVMLTLLSSLSTQPEISFSVFVGDFQFLAMPEMNKQDYQLRVDSCERLIERDLGGFQIRNEILDKGLLQVCYEDQPKAGHLWTLTGSLFILTISIIILSLGFVSLARRLIFYRLRSLSAILGDTVQDRFLMIGQGGTETTKPLDEFEAIEEELARKTRLLISEQTINRAIYLDIIDGLVVTDQHFKIRRANKVFCDQLNITTIEAVDQDLSKLVPVKCLAKECNWCEVSMSSGKILSFHLSKLGVPDIFSGYLLVSRDITEERRKELEIQHAQKMAAIGSISGGVAHDFNNFLAVIMGNTELVLLDSDLDEIQLTRMDAIKRSAENGIALVDQLLTFARKQDLRSVKMEPNTAVYGACELAGRALAPNISLSLDIVTRSMIETDPSYFESALLNLIINAGDAMPEGGTIKVGAHDAEQQGEPVVAFSVADQGCGISPELIEKIKEPFFTTKPNGEGTGLGLSMVSGFAEQSGGSLELISMPGKTIATIYLPAIPAVESVLEENVVETENEPESTTISVQAQQNHLSILIVDDVKMMRDVVRDQLNMLGHSVFSLRSLSEVANAPDLADFDLVYCDIALENETGDTIWRYFRDSGLATPFVFMSGNVPDRVERSILETDALYLLRKPFTLEEIKASLELYREFKQYGISENIKQCLEENLLV